MFDSTAQQKSLTHNPKPKKEEDIKAEADEDEKPKAD